MSKSKKWTDKDLLLMETAWMKGVSDAKIAKILQRSERSVAVKRHKLGLCLRSLEVNGGSVRQYHDTTLLIEMRRRGYYCLREVRNLRDYSDRSMATELRRRGYLVRREKK